MPRLTLLLGWILAAGLAPGSVAAGEIHGTLRLPGQVTRSRLASSDSSWFTGQLRPTITEAVIYLDAIPGKLETKLARNAAPALMAPCCGTFIPRTLALAAGTVTFENQDRVYHNAFSRSPARTFDIGKYAPGERRLVTFDKPGVVQVFCEIDPNEAGFILVTPNHAFTQPDAAGTFHLPKLPPGRYRLHVWHPLFGSESREIEMPRRGDLSVALRL